MKITSFFGIKLFPVALFFLFAAQSYGQSIVVENRSVEEVSHYTVEIPVEEISLAYGDYMVVTENGEALPLEITADINGNRKAIFPVAHLAGNAKKVFQVKKGTADKYPKRTYAELAHKIGGEFVGPKYEGGYAWVKPNRLTVDGAFRDHAYYIKYEGPGWESDMVGFRFYLDQRNAVDVFGKKTPGIVLPFVGVDGYDSYHEMADWGMDNMKVGNALGLGSIAIWDGTKAIRVEKRDSVTCYIPADGKIRSQVMTTYYGWDANGAKCNLESLISIDAGNRASRMELKVDNRIDNIATGIIKSKDAKLIMPADGNEKTRWSYIATFGKQSLNNDMMGLAVFYRHDQLKEITEDALNHVVVLSPENGCVEYYFMPTWELDWQPVKDEKEFRECLDEMVRKLNHSVSVIIQ